MKILIIGGTRLLGKEVVEAFVGEGHDVTVISRRKVDFNDRVRFINDEKTKGVSSIAGERYDYTLDFIAFDRDSSAVVLNNIIPGIYVLFSTIWMVKFNENIAANGITGTVESAMFRQLPLITQNYISGKKTAEDLVLQKRAEGVAATVLRLPIFWDRNEHTQRLKFYVSRSSDGFPMFLVNGGANKNQIAWVKDLVFGIKLWIGEGIAMEQPIWEALPGKGVESRDTIKCIGEALGKDPVFADISSDILKKELPEYLESEPLWREKELENTDSNIFNSVKISPMKQSDWLKKIVPLTEISSMSELRKKEIELIRRLDNA